jgi:DNA repair exonuclease SbcCD ATPase subunit
MKANPKRTVADFNSAVSLSGLPKSLQNLLSADKKSSSVPLTLSVDRDAIKAFRQRARTGRMAKATRGLMLKNTIKIKTKETPCTPL